MHYAEAHLEDHLQVEVVAVEVVVEAVVEAVAEVAANQAHNQLLHQDQYKLQAMSKIWDNSRLYLTETKPRPMISWTR